ncbi:hypothetical protein Y032_0008g164 [Ancylostoma ceylanicum]|uniref:Uncharacterized protein n=1 Tax=Ancylostoma ceylanicum TaxID=53326 RepID=A0A016VL56_9BILA|nr:hypothetical protein Y032_0008g164 [Ancylostoma ceylanicum]
MCLYYLFSDSKTEDNWRSYHGAKNAVAATKAAHYDEVCKKLDAKDGPLSISHQHHDDIETFHDVNDEQGLP